MTLMKEAWLALVTQRAPQEQRRQAPQPVCRAGASSIRTAQVSQPLWEPKAENSHPYKVVTPCYKEQGNRRHELVPPRGDTSPTQAEMPQLPHWCRGISAGGC